MKIFFWFFGVRLYLIFIADTGIPTSVDFIRSEPNHMVAAYNNKTACIFDMESAKPILKFEYEPNDGKCSLCYEYVILGRNCSMKLLS